MTIKVPGVYGISALAYDQGRGLKQQPCSGSLLGISREGELMPPNPLISLNMTSADRDRASHSFKSSHQHFVCVDWEGTGFATNWQDDNISTPVLAICNKAE